MKLIKKTSQSRRDFLGNYECEGCGNIEENVSGYDDDYFHENVTTKMKCKKCELSTIDMNLVSQKVKTKYEQHEVI